LTSFLSKRSMRIILSLIVLIPLGLFTKIYSGTGKEWVNNSCGGILYVIFFCLLISLIYPKTSPLKICFSIFLVTCLIEVLQLWQPSFLVLLRKNFIIQILIGTTFSWLDMVHYFLGSLIGWFWLKIFLYESAPQ
jgi:hypothetical protein